jgi:hypothetical protein
MLLNKNLFMIILSIFISGSLVANEEVQVKDEQGKIPVKEEIVTESSDNSDDTDVDADDDDSDDEE